MRAYCAILFLASLSHARRVQTSFDQLGSAPPKPLSSTLLASQPASVGAVRSTNAQARPIPSRSQLSLAGGRSSSVKAKMVATIDPSVSTTQESEEITEINYYDLDQIDASKILEGLHAMVAAAAKISSRSDSADEKYNKLLADPAVMSSLIALSRLPVFSTDFALAFKDNLELLRCLKQLKYFWSIPQSQLTILLKQLAVELNGTTSPEAAILESFQKDTAEMTEQVQMLARLLPGSAGEKYIENAEYLEIADPHAVYPTSIYRQCDGLTLATKDASTIEAVMSTAITTTIKIARDVLEPSNELLYNVYKPLGRCVAVVDDKVDAAYGEKLDAYFAAHGIKFTKLVFSGNEADKDIRDVERILVALKEIGLARNEPLLVVGGGVIADIAGFATSMYSRNTPYVMLCTSIVAGIDAGPSPRVCCNGFDYKNLYGAYHPPVLTITDRGFWKSLHPGWLRHGVAEIIKMAVMKDISLFNLMEKWGPKCLQTKFGTEGESIDDPEFQDVCDLIVGKAMEGYVRSEYGNLWETHQARPHAYGHTWCPGYELKSGMLHGQAVGTCMGYGAYLAYVKGFIPQDEMHRILKVISDCELALWHPIMEDKEAIWKSNLAIIEKRGGNLAAPVPKPLGESGYINELSEADLYRTVEEYKTICETYPRKGRGVDEHCVDVGLEDPQAKKKPVEAALASTLLAMHPSLVRPARFSGGEEARSTTSAKASAVATVETAEAKSQSETQGYVGRFDGSNSKHASPAMAAAGTRQHEAQEDVTALPTSTKWSVLSSRVEGLVAELSQVVGKQDAYCVSKSNAEGPAMAAVREKMISTAWADEYKAGRTMFSYGEEMSTDPLEAMLIKYFSFMAKPKRILEIGMFVGYGAVSMLEGWPSANVVSLEIDPYLKEWLASCLVDFPELRERHEIVLGPALESLPTLEGEFDMVFIDANKAEYKDYVQKILDGGLLAKDGVIVCDNILYNGYPYVNSHFDAQPARRGFGDAVKDFNQWVYDHPELEQIVLPIRDGVSLLRRRQ